MDRDRERLIEMLRNPDVAGLCDRARNFVINKANEMFASVSTETTDEQIMVMVKSLYDF